MQDLLTFVQSDNKDSVRQNISNMSPVEFDSYLSFSLSVFVKTFKRYSF